MTKLKAKVRAKAGAAGAAAPLEPLIVRVRGQRVILDADLARLYGVNTKVLNQAVKRNAERFPEDLCVSAHGRRSREL